jgi:hypothetical protein
MGIPEKSLGESFLLVAGKIPAILLGAIRINLMLIYIYVGIST